MTVDADRLPDVLDIFLVASDPLEIELTLRSLRAVAPEYRIGVARDGEEALDYLLGRGRYRHRFGGPMPRVTLLELKLPKVDGLEMLRALRGNPRTSSAPVVVLSSAVDIRDVAQSYQFGANSCVRKPVDFGQFNRVLQTLAHYWLELNEAPSALGRPVS